MKYFKVGLESKEMKNLSALGPKNRCKPETVRRIKYLGKRFLRSFTELILSLAKTDLQRNP